MTHQLYRFYYSNQAEKFLKRKGSELTKEQAEVQVVTAIRRITHEEVNSSDVIAMKGDFKWYFRVREGKIRIIFTYLEGSIRIVNINRIDYRGNVYE